MTRAPNRPFLLIVVEPANDRGRMAEPIGLWPIRWLRSGSIGRLRLASPTHCPLRADDGGRPREGSEQAGRRTSRTSAPAPLPAPPTRTGA